ncbi:MAG: radical SAM protein, partial [Clostridia bacterium]|nr:radical SAM protein [Clostridia bacterium]
PEEEVLCEVKRLHEGGCREIVLTGIETASYGKDLGSGTDITTLLAEIDKIPNIGRIRIGSIDPSVMTEDFVDRISEIKCLAPHFHISMQSGSNRILGLMRRKYNRKMALDSIDRLRRKIPNVMLTTDFIVGFPTETDEDFEDTMDFAKRAKFLNIHVFAYSRRSGTPAAEMSGQVPQGVKKARSTALISLAEKLTAKALEDFTAENHETEVLFETYENGMAFGHTASFVPVCVNSKTELNGELKNVILNGSDKARCFGELKGE